MAMAMPQAWGKKKIGSWADESEAPDSDSLPPPPPPLAPAPAPAPAPEDGFPSLSKPAATGPKKKTKGQTLTLAEFTTGKHLGPGASKRSSTSVSSSSSTPSSTGIFMSSDRLTPEELLYLPTGPKDRSGDEPQEPRFGFRSYGGFRNEPRRAEREREPPTSMPPPPSRADESSDWFSSKNPRDFHQQQQAPRRFDHPPHSKADEVDSWSQGKSRPEVDHGNTRGFMEWGGGRRGMHAAQIPRSDSSDRWREDGGGEDERWPRRMEELPQRRRLNLQPRSLPVESSPGAATSPVSGLNPGSRASSGEFSSRPGTPSSPVPSESKPRVNPFGSAKPREMVLQERGQDWRKLDLELEHKRVETEEEKRLKQEILHLKDELLQGESPEIKQQLENKELELAELTKELETKARVTPDTHQPPRPQSSHDTWSRPPSSHGTRSRNVNSSDTWRRPRTPMQEQEWSRRSSGDHQFHQQHQQHHRPRTASGDYYNRPRTPDLWRRDSDQHHHHQLHHQHNNHFSNHHFNSFNNNNENDQFGRADMWSRPRTPSVHDPDEWNSGRSAGTTPTAAAAAAAGHGSRW